MENCEEACFLSNLAYETRVLKLRNPFSDPQTLFVRKHVSLGSPYHNTLLLPPDTLSPRANLFVLTFVRTGEALRRPMLDLVVVACLSKKKFKSLSG